MAQPRQVLPGEFHQITRRCAQRQLLLRPDDGTNNAYTYCLGEAAERFEITVIVTMAEANHHHTTIFDRYGRYPAFMEHFHKMLARSQNVLRGRTENFWAAVQPCVTRLLDRDTVIAQIVYAAANPVKDGLVERAHHWPGVNGYRNLISGRPLRARRPRHFFRSSGTMPETVELHMTIPPELGPAEQVIAEVRAGVEEVERRAAEERRRTGARVLGRRRVLEQSWKDAPASTEPRTTLRPRFAGRTLERIAALLQYKAFLAAYREARRLWLAGKRAAFPPGTYLLARLTTTTGPPV
jgi:putative transposase